MGEARRGTPNRRPGQRQRPDGVAHLGCVVDQLALPFGEALVEVGLVRVGLPDGVAEDAVRVHLVGQVRPALRDVLRRLRQHLVDLLAAEVVRLVREELGVLEVRARRREAAALEEHVDRGRVAVQPAQERGGERRVLRLGRDRLAAAAVLGRDGCAVVGRDRRHAPVAGRVRDARLEHAGHPRARHERRDRAVAEALVPLVGPAGRGREEVLLDELVPDAGPLPGALVGEVDGHVGAVDRERTAAGLPDHARREAGVAGVGGDVLRRVGRVQLASRGDVLVPRGRHGDAVLVEDGLVVEQRHGAGVLREADELAVDVHGAPGGGAVLVLEVVEAVLAQVDERVGERELRHGVVLDLHDVGGTGARLDRILQLRVLLGVGTGVDELDVDVRVRLLECGDLCLGARGPAPVGELTAGLEGGVEVVGAAAARGAGARGAGGERADRERGGRDRQGPPDGGTGDGHVMLPFTSLCHVVRGRTLRSSGSGGGVGHACRSVTA